MSAYVAVIALLMASQVSAVPEYWEKKHQGCTLPTQPYKNHLAPINDTGLIFTLTDSTGAPAASYSPNASYTLKVSYPAQVHIWVGTSGGFFATQTASTGCNGLSAYMGMDTDTSFSVTWNAPETCSNVTVFTNAAKSGADNFRQATTTVPCKAGTDATTPTASPPATTPSPTAPPTPTPSPSPSAGAAASVVFSAVAVVAAMMALLM